MSLFSYFLIFNVLAILVAILPIGVIFEDYNKSYYSFMRRFNTPWFYVRFKNRILTAGFKGLVKNDLPPFNYPARITVGIFFINIILLLFLYLIKLYEI